MRVGGDGGTHDDAEVVGERPAQRVTGRTTERPAERATSVRRLDDRLGLAVDRVPRSARTLVTYARDHVTVRTPSRPDFRDGNTLDLESPPAAADLDRWVTTFDRTIGTLGVAHVQLRWETPLPSGGLASVPDPDPALRHALTERGFELSAHTALLLDTLVEPPKAPVQLTVVDPPSAVPGGAVDRRWHAAGVLYRYEQGDTPEDWRGGDEAFVRWSIDVQRELVRDGRAAVWLAVRHGAPVARLTLAHDRQGLAAIEDVIVHPAHRRLGIAGALTHRAIAAHLDADPAARVGLGADPGSTADRLYRRLGFRPHATVWTALRLTLLT